MLITKSCNKTNRRAKRIWVMEKKKIITKQFHTGLFYKLLKPISASIIITPGNNFLLNQFTSEHYGNFVTNRNVLKSFCEVQCICGLGKNKLQHFYLKYNLESLKPTGAQNAVSFVKTTKSNTFLRNQKNWWL